VLWKETAFPRWRATDSRWNRYVVSLVSSVTAVICRPSSCTNSTAWLFQVPAVSMATGTKMWLLASCLYSASLLFAALASAAPAVVAVSARCECRKVHKITLITRLHEQNVTGALYIVCKYAFRKAHWPVPDHSSSLGHVPPLYGEVM